MTDCRVSRFIEIKSLKIHRLELWVNTFALFSTSGRYSLKTLASEGNVQDFHFTYEKSLTGHALKSTPSKTRYVA